MSHVSREDYCETPAPKPYAEGFLWACDCGKVWRLRGADLPGFAERYHWWREWSPPAPKRKRRWRWFW